MSVPTAKIAAVGFAATLILMSTIAFAQSVPPKPNPMDGLMNQLIRAQGKLGPNAKHISGAMRNAFAMAHHWESLKAGVIRAATASSTTPALSVLPLASSTVTKPSLASRVVGLTQSETSTAWCGTNAVIGFNDTGSILETINGALTGGGLSSVGYAQSTNANVKTPVFADQGFVPAVPGGGLLIGDPVVACSSASNFYMSNVGFSCQFVVQNGGLACGATDSNVNVSISHDGGATFAPPVLAVDKSFAPNILGLPNHILDKDWMAIDPNSGELYVTYTDIDNSSDPGNECGSITIGPFTIPIQRVAIEMVSSINGTAWSAPVEITHVCDDPSSTTPNIFVQGSQIAIRPDGSVYVAWETTGTTSTPSSEIDIASSTDHGMTFSAPSLVTPVNCVGDCIDGILQGSIRITELPSLVAGKGTQSGKLFLTWNDGDNPQPDAGIGTYNFADVKLVSSSDGVTWSSPVKVNNNPASNTDHFQPAVSSDQSGRVAVCFYDRRNDPNNFYIDRYCANSTNGGASFGTNTRITAKSFLSVVNQDLQLGGNDYMGDYDTLASDTMNSTKGFRGGFGDNLIGAPNVQANKF